MCSEETTLAVRMRPGLLIELESDGSAAEVLLAKGSKDYNFTFVESLGQVFHTVDISGSLVSA